MPRSLVGIGGIQSDVTTNTMQVNGNTEVKNMSERVVTHSGAPSAAAVDIDISRGTLHNFTANASANFTFNFIASGAPGGLKSVVGPGQAITVAVLVPNSDPAFFLANATIDGVAFTTGELVWNGASGSPSAGVVNSIDAYSFTFTKTMEGTIKVFGNAGSTGGSFGEGGGGPIEPGEATFLNAGSYNWTVPDGVWKVHVAAVGGGGGGQNGWANPAGAGAGLGWKNEILVTPGSSVQVVVGSGGGNADNGGTSYFVDTNTVAGYGGGSASGDTSGPNSNGRGGGYVGDGGGAGGNANDWTGGGGAAGYTGNGGNKGSSGSGGSGAGGNNYSSTWGTGAGGGVGMYGEGSSGNGFYTPWNGNGSPGGGGNGGSSGDRGMWGENPWSGRGQSSNNIQGGNYGGGGGGPGTNWPSTSGNGAPGAVRVIWGDGREWPTTSVAQSDSNGNVTNY